MRMGIPTVNQFGIDYYLGRNMALNKSLVLRKILLPSSDPAMNSLEFQSLGTQNIPGKMDETISTQ